MRMAVLIVALLVADYSFAIDHSHYSTSEECLACHPRTPPTHKRQRPLSNPEDFPLDSSGRMLCITCHECITGTCELRKPKPALCLTCHDCQRGMACLIGVAHLGTSPDIESRVHDCLTCHDGSVGRVAGGPGEHKTDVLYIAGREFNVITDRRVVLVNGKITCISCHNPYATDIGKLSKENTESRLCLTCHRK